MLGLHDRRSAKEPNRWQTLRELNISYLCVARRQIRVSEIIVHESFDFSFHDIALLKLGTDVYLVILVIITCYTEERVDLSVFSPVCLPSIGETFVNQEGLVYGEQTNVEKVFFTLVLFRLGSHWSYRHLDRQAAGDLGPDSAEQHLLGEDEPDRGCE